VIASKVIDEIEARPSFEEMASFPDITDAARREAESWLWNGADRANREGKRSLEISTHYARFIALMLHKLCTEKNA
jgi:hypothetical protein